MKPEEFIELVRQMREMQKAYFKFRGSEMLRRSKALEAQVDAAIHQFKGLST